MLNRAQQFGFTLTETMIAVSILSILAAMAAPSFTATLERRKIIAAVEATQSDLRWARGEAIKRNKQIRVTFTTGSSWSYKVAVAPYNSIDELKTVNGSNFPSTTLSTASFAGGVAYTTFDPTRGTASAGNVTITSNNYSANSIVSTLGRVRVCGSMGSYESCP